MCTGKIYVLRENDSHVKDEFRDLQPPLQVMSSSNPGSGVASYVGNLFSIKSVQPGDLDFFEALYCGVLGNQAIRPDQWMAIFSRAQRLISTNGPETQWCNGKSPVSTSTVPWQEGLCGEPAM